MKKMMSAKTEKKNDKGRDEKMKNMMKKAAQLAAVMMITVSSMMGCVSKQEEEKDTKTAVNNQKDKEKENKKNREQRKKDTTANPTKEQKNEEAANEETAQQTTEKKKENKETKPSPTHQTEKTKKPQATTEKSKNPQKEEATKPDKENNQAQQEDKEESNKQENQANQGDKEESNPGDQTHKEEGKDNQPVDDQALRTALKEAAKVAASTYTPTSYAIFQKTIASATQALEKGNLNEAAIQTWITRIRQAQQQLIVKGDHTALTALMKTAESYQEKEYTPASYQVLQAAMQKANQIIGNEDASQTMIDTAAQEVETAIHSLVKRADVTALQELMDKAAMIHKDSYVAESYHRLEMAMAQAEVVLHNAQASQQDVNAVIRLVEQAIADLELYEAPDMEELTQLLQQAAKVSAKDYSASSYKQLQTAIKQGEAVVSMKQPTQTQVEDAVANLKTAFKELCVDTKNLTAAIAQAQQFQEAYYTSDSYQYMLSIVSKAQSYLQNHPTQEGVDALYDQLQEAMEQLVVVQKVDKTQLQAKLAELKQLTEQAYTPSSYQQLQEAMQACEAIIQDEKANEKQVEDALALLQAAQNQLVPKGDRTALEALLNQAQSAIQGNYMKEGIARVEEAIMKAKETNQNLNATQGDVDESCLALQQAMDALMEKGDAAKLQDMVDAAKNMDMHQYTPESAAAYLAAVEKAQALLDKEEFSKQAEIDMVEELDQAKAALVKQKADKHQLQELLQESEAYVLEGYYTADSIAAFKSIQTQAAAMLNDEEATQEAVDAMLSQLRKAMDDLQTVDNLTEKLAARLQDVTLVDARVHTKDSMTQLKQCAQDIQNQMTDVTLSDQVKIHLLQQLETAFAQLQLDTSQVEAMIAKAEAIEPDKYTAASIQSMNEALQTARNVTADAHHTADALAQAMDALDYAMKQLVEVPETGLKEQLEALLVEGKAKVGNHNANDFTTASYDRYAKAVYDADKALRWIEYGSYDLTKPADIQTVTAIRDELKEAIQELTLAEGIKPEDQAYIDTLQKAVAKGQEALNKGGYPPVQGKTLANKVANVEESIAGIQNHTSNYPHNEAGQLLIQDLVTSIDTAIAKLYEEPQVQNIPVQEEVVRLLNEKRKEAGLNEVVIDEQVSQAATKRASEMSEYFYVMDASFAQDAHKRPDGSRCDTIKAEFGIQGLMAENAAFSATNATQLFNAWWNSDGHRQNMMTANYTRIGVADVQVGEEGYTLGYMLLVE